MSLGQDDFGLVTVRCEVVEKEIFAGEKPLDAFEKAALSAAAARCCFHDDLGALAIMAPTSAVTTSPWLI